jgi:hypothetical protein
MVHMFEGVSVKCNIGKIYTFLISFSKEGNNLTDVT